jgi:sugar phosphate isomerase/epimerase
MKFCFPAWAWESRVKDKLPLEEALKRISALGGDGVEIWVWMDEMAKRSALPSNGVSSFNDERISKLKKIAQEGDLTFVTIDLHPVGMCNDDVDERKSAIQYVKDSLDLCRKLGGKIVTSITVPLPDGVSFKDAWQRTVEFVAESVAYAKEQGVTFAIEPEPGTFIANADSFILLSREVPGVGANIDCGHHHLVREDLRAAVEKVGDKLVYVHLDDNDATADQARPLGKGTIGREGFSKFITALKNVGYKGYLAFDIHPTENPDQALKESLEYLREIVRESYPEIL